MGTRAIKIDQKGEVLDMVTGEVVGNLVDMLTSKMEKRGEKCRFISKSGSIYIFSCEEKTK